MTDIALPTGAQVQLRAPSVPELVMATAGSTSVPVIPVQGIRGPAGPPGADGKPGTFLGTAWWYGSGQPEMVIGSKPGDYYMDTQTGQVWILGD